jgi:hypothetical protein
MVMTVMKRGDKHATKRVIHMNVEARRGRVRPKKR